MTFLIKEKINELIKEIKIIESCPKQTKLLVDVCKCSNEETKNIVIWTLANTLVTNKL